MLHLSSLRRGVPATLNTLLPEPEQPLSRLHDHRAQRVSPLQTKPLEDGWVHAKGTWGSGTQATPLHSGGRSEPEPVSLTKWQRRRSDLLTGTQIAQILNGLKPTSYNCTTAGMNNVTVESMETAILFERVFIKNGLKENMLQCESLRSFIK